MKKLLPLEPLTSRSASGRLASTLTFASGSSTSALGPLPLIPNDGKFTLKPPLGAFKSTSGTLASTFTLASGSSNSPFSPLPLIPNFGRPIWNPPLPLGALISTSGASALTLISPSGKSTSISPSALIPLPFKLTFGRLGKPIWKPDLPPLDANLPEADIKGGKSGFHIGLPSLPKVNLKGKGIKADGDIDVDLPEGDINVKAEAPDVDIKAPKGSGGFHIGLPKFGIKGKGEKGEFELPEANVNVDANVPDVDLKAPKGGFNVNLPSFGIKGKGPKAEVGLPDANVNVDASLPDADLDVKGSKGKSFFTQNFLKIIKLLILSFDF